MPDEQPSLCISVSVSCIGSNGLKLKCMKRRLKQFECFSILYRIEWVETCYSRTACVAACYGFSILYRIEWVETWLPASAHSADTGVSVSCIGSNGLKLLGETDALGEMLVSVSCIGSNGLKPPIRTRAGRPISVSVSCIGSNGLKRVGVHRLRPSKNCFSILYRIEWVETRWGGGVRVHLRLSVSCIGSNGLKQSIPGSSSSPWPLSVSCIGSNGLKLTEASTCKGTLSGFQYPVSDRMG